MKYQRKSIRIQLKFQLNSNRFALEILFKLYWNTNGSIGNSVQNQLKFQWKPIENQAENIMKYKWKSIGFPVEMTMKPIANPVEIQ